MAGARCAAHTRAAVIRSARRPRAGRGACPPCSSAAAPVRTLPPLSVRRALFRRPRRHRRPTESPRPTALQ